MSQQFGSYSRDIAVGKSLRNALSETGQFIALGNDWSSTFAYFAERKSFTIPDWFTRSDDVLMHPEKYLDADQLGGVVFCGGGKRSPIPFTRFVERNKWNVASVGGCHIAFPGAIFSDNGVISTECNGAIDVNEIAEERGARVAEISGWVVPIDGDSRVRERVYIQLPTVDVKPAYFEALRTPRDDINSNLNIPSDELSGFSALVPLQQEQDIKDVVIIRSRGDVKNICRLTH